MRRDDAALADTGAGTEGLAVRFELDEGRNKGFLYCYKWLGSGRPRVRPAFDQGGYGRDALFGGRAALHWPEKSCTFEPVFFFEEDRVFYLHTRY